MTASTKPLWLVAHDFSACSDAAADAAGKLAAKSGAKLLLLNVHPVEIREAFERTGAETFGVEEEKRGMLRQCADRLRQDNGALDIDVEVLAGPTVPCVLQEADRLGAEMIVVGTHGRKGVSHLLLGSVAETLVHDAPVPVLVVKMR